jgi:hypothetical protein
MVIAQHPAPDGEHVAAQLLGFGVTAPQADYPGQGMTGDERVGMARAKDALPVGQEVTVLGLGLGVAALQPGWRGW